MDQLETFHVSLAPEIATQVKQAVENGEYPSASELIGDALRNWSLGREQSTSHRLQVAWEEAIADERPALEAEPVFSRLRARFATQSAGTK